MSPAKLRRLRRERAAERAWQTNLMHSIVDERQRGERGCKIIVGESSLHARRQPTLTHEPAPERVVGVSLLTEKRGGSYTRVFGAPTSGAYTWQPPLVDVVGCDWPNKTTGVATIEAAKATDDSRAPIGSGAERLRLVRASMENAHDGPQ